MKKIWHDQAWEDYLNLQNDKKLLKKTKSDYKKTTEKKLAKDFQMFSLSHLIAFSFLCCPVVL